MAYTEQLQARIDQLRALPWADIKEAAEAVDIEKPDGTPWKDMTDEIAIAEFTAQQLPIHVEDVTEDVEQPENQQIEFTSDELIEALATVLPEDLAQEVADEVVERLVGEEVIQNTYSTQLYNDLGLPVCSVCSEKHRHGPQGQPICPVSKPDCPRLT
jgi:hypothetical protein